MRDCRYALQGGNCNRVDCHFNHDFPDRFNPSRGRGRGQQYSRGRFHWNEDRGQWPADYGDRRRNESWNDSGGSNDRFQER